MYNMALSGTSLIVQKFSRDKYLNNDEKIGLQCNLPWFSKGT